MCFAWDFVNEILRFFGFERCNFFPFFKRTSSNTSTSTDEEQNFPPEDNNEENDELQVVSYGDPPSESVDDDEIPDLEDPWVDRPDEPDIGDYAWAVSYGDPPSRRFNNDEIPDFEDPWTDPPSLTELLDDWLDPSSIPDIEGAYVHFPEEEMDAESEFDPQEPFGFVLVEPLDPVNDNNQDASVLQMDDSDSEYDNLII